MTKATTSSVENGRAPDSLGESTNATNDAQGGRIAATGAALVAGVHVLLRVALGEESIVTIHDNLDSDFLYRVLIARDNRLFSGDAVITELVGGTPRWLYPPGLKLGSILFHAMTPFSAYVVLEAFVHAAAVFGMWLLLRDHLGVARNHALAIAATFGFLPFYPIYDLSVAGQPWVAWALLNLSSGRRVFVSLGVCAAFPFASVLPTAGVFVIALAAIALGVDALKARRLALFPAVGVAVMVIGYFITDWSFIRHHFDPGFVSHRSRWHTSRGSMLSASRVAALSLRAFVYGKYHAASLHTPILLFSAYVAACLRRRKERTLAARIDLAIVTAFVFVVLIELPNFRGLFPLARAIPALRLINIRFWWSLPALWYATLGIVAASFSRTGIQRRWLDAFLAFQLGWVIAAPIGSEPELRRNLVAVATRMAGRTPSSLSYREFLSRAVFDRMRARMGDHVSGRVVSLGLDPAIAAYNGFDCADGYRDDYPAAYKDRFRRLIAGELAQNPVERSYFDDWGSRAYVFLHGSSNLVLHERPKRAEERLHELALSEDAIRDLGIEWIFSLYRLEGAALLPFLRYEGAFGDPSAAFTVHLYRVAKAGDP